LPRFVFTSGANGAASSSVTLAGRRYIVCRNHQEAEKDAADQAAIVAALTLRPLAPRRGSDPRNTAACQSSSVIVVDMPR
jgi:hypothetical protein